MEDITLNNPTKESVWESKLAECSKIIDGLGLEMDENIKECVVGLWLNGFNTSSSCGGHIENIEDKEVLRFPYVNICEKDQPEYRFVDEEQVTKNIMIKHGLKKENEIFDNNEIEEEYNQLLNNLEEETEEYKTWFQLNLKVFDRLIKFIDEYNSHRGSRVLKLESSHPNASVIYNCSEKTREEFIKAQEEFSLFAKYLKNKYFNDKH
jgi:hypothetical protein